MSSPGRSDWGGIWLGLAVSSFAAFQMLKLPPSLPLLIEAYGYGRVVAGALVSVYALAGIFFSMTAGTLTGRYPAHVLAGSLACFFLGNAVTLIFPEVAWINLVARTIEGLAYTVFAIAGAAIANRSAAPADLSMVAGIVAVWVPVGQILALATGYLFFDSLGWQPLWWLSLFLTLALALWLLARRTGVERALRVEVHDAGAGQLRQRFSLWLAAGVFAAWAGQYIAFMTWLPDYVVGHFQVGADEAAAINAVSVAGVLASCLATGWLLRKGVSFGLLFSGATVIQAMVWFAGPYLDSLAGLVAITAYGIVSGAPPTCMFAVPARLFGGARAGPSAFAPLMTGRSLGVLLAPVVAGGLVDTGGWTVFAWTYGILTFAAAAAGGLMAILVTRRGR
ncbi:MAG: MFS transporter [bacterium]|nr:MFS transporter [bacterium]